MPWLGSFGANWFRCRSDADTTGGFLTSVETGLVLSLVASRAVPVQVDSKVHLLLLSTSLSSRTSPVPETSIRCCHLIYHRPKPALLYFARRTALDQQPSVATCSWNSTRCVSPEKACRLALGHDKHPSS